jgi:hypothetical protein
MQRIVIVAGVVGNWETDGPPDFNKENFTLSYNIPVKEKAVFHYFIRRV